MKSASQLPPDIQTEFTPVIDALCEGYGPEARDLVQRAAELAWPVRDNQAKLPTPFAVASELKSLGVDATTLAASLIGARVCEPVLDLDEVERTFGPGITALVKSVRWTNTFQEGEFVQQGNVDDSEQSERLRRMVLAMVEDVRVVLIKLAERTGQNENTLRSQLHRLRRAFRKQLKAQVYPTVAANEEAPTELLTLVESLKPR